MLQITHADGNLAKTDYGAGVTADGGATAQFCSTATYGLGYPVLSLDESSKKRQTWTDGFGRTIEVDEPDQSGNLTVNTCYSYDLLGNLTQVAQGSQTRTYAYDGLSRATVVTTPESGTANFYYTTSGGALCAGSAGAVCRRTDARGITATYTYDALNRLTGISYAGGGTSTAPVTYSYDQTSYNGLTITNGKGHRTGMSDGSGITAWSYDAAGRIVTEQRTIAGITKTISYNYNLDGSLNYIIYPSGRKITYGVSNAQRPTSAKDVANNIQYAVTASYSPPGGLSSVIYGQVSGGFGGVTESRAYNNRLEPGTVQASSSAGTALNLSYCYYLWSNNSCQSSTTNNGNVKGIQNVADSGRNETLTYDPLNHINSAASNATSGVDCWGQNFSTPAIDRWDNLWDMTATQCSPGSLSVSVDSATNRINTTGYQYDAAGNMTNDAVHTYTYDAENRIATAAGVTYTYDGNGLRVEKSNGTLYWRAISGDTIAESDPTGSTTNSSYHEYVFFAGRRIARRDTSGSIFYYYSDHLGTVRSITQSNGTVCYDADFTPYGTELAHANTCPQNYKFTGYERDAETGLDYAFARYYNPRLGRFMTPDPLGGAIGDPESLNRYAYVGNNPRNFIDPLGLTWCNYDTDPTCFPSPDPNPTTGFRGASGPFFGDGPGCTLDGGWAPCSLVWAVVGAGAGAVCPNNNCNGVVLRGDTFYQAQWQGINPGIKITCDLSGHNCQTTDLGHIIWVRIWVPIANAADASAALTAISQGPSLTKVFMQALWRNFKDEWQRGCVSVFLQAGLDGGILPDLPAGSGVDDAAREGGQAAAVTYAVSNGLAVPLRSSIYRGILTGTETLATGVLAVDLVVKAGEGAWAEGKAMWNGTCH